MTMEERISLLEFQIELLCHGTNIDRLLVEAKITREQYNAIADLLDSIRTRLEKGEEVYHGSFESEMYRIVPSKDGDYGFCELITELLAEDGRWEEVFSALYGNMTKYKGLA